MTDAAAAASVVVTGANGFVGRHLVSELAANHIQVVGIGTESQPASEIANALDEYVHADLVKGWPALAPASAIIHLAGLATVGPSFDDPQTYLTVNSTMVTHLCEHFVATGIGSRVVLASSGAVYAASQVPLTEASAITIGSPYALSKVVNENQAAYYRGRGIECVIARPFNHIGPGQSKGFLLPDLATALIEAGDQPMIAGNLATKRDFTDVRDVARAYRLIATSTDLAHSVYNICSGRSHAGTDILNIIAESMGMSGVRTETDPTRVRPNDPDDIVGDNSRLRNDVGWVPQIALEESVEDYLKGL